MPFNGSGGASQPASSIYPATANTLIESAKANISIADIYTMLAGVITKDGQTTTTLRIPFAAGISTDTITEKTLGAGVTVDSVILKAGGATLTSLLTGTAATFSSTIALTGVISPTQVSANTNDWAPSSLATAAVIRFSTDARRNITGLTGGATGRLLTLYNVGTFPAVFTFQDALSSAANRFAFGCTLGGGQCMALTYDGTSSLWRAAGLPPDPVGRISDFGGGTVPSGYLACDASAVSRTTYAALFNEIGTTWGVGDGSTTFNVPDFRRRTAVGSGGAGTGTLGNAVGNTGGEEAHALSIAELASHSHTPTYNDITGIIGGGGSGLGPGGSSASSIGLSIGNTGSGTAHNTIQPSAVTTKMIKF
jgi:hypothetical protein